MSFSQPAALLESQNNCFLIDWLTFVCHGETVDYLKSILGLSGDDIPWQISESFLNGYPVQCFWNGITISYGADDPNYYKDPNKVRHDMGICVNLSGTGCRAFESHGHGNWIRLFTYLFRDTDFIAREHHSLKSYNITRLDLAYDDHTGILDMQQLEHDIRYRYYVSRAKHAEAHWSDNLKEDIQGLTLEIGSKKSDVLIRIYDKAAERGHKDGRHWIRVETQLRKERAHEACRMLLSCKHVGKLVSGILRNYLTFRTPSSDSNKSRWPIAPYWDKVLLDMDRISLWISPGEPYNLSKTEHWLIKQYGQAIVVLDAISENPTYLVDRCKELNPIHELSPKYKQFLLNYSNS